MNWQLYSGIVLLAGLAFCVVVLNKMPYPVRYAISGLTLLAYRGCRYFLKKFILEPLHWFYIRIVPRKKLGVACGYCGETFDIEELPIFQRSYSKCICAECSMPGGIMVRVRKLHNVGKHWPLQLDNTNAYSVSFLFMNLKKRSQVLTLATTRPHMEDKDYYLFDGAADLDDNRHHQVDLVLEDD
jgi:hypothetical protein